MFVNNFIAKLVHFGVNNNNNNNNNKTKTVNIHYIICKFFFFFNELRYWNSMSVLESNLKKKTFLPITYIPFYHFNFLLSYLSAIDPYPEVFQSKVNKQKKRKIK